MVNTLVAALTEPHSETCSNANRLSCPATPTPSPYVVEHLSDTELLAGTRGLVARSNHQLARLLAHLAEVEARGIHRVRACSSLYTYCVYELRLPEDTAFRYARAAKLARKFPVLFEQLAAGELHLTGLLLLGSHLTDDNRREVLQLAKHRTKREIIKLVRRLDPLPDVPPGIESQEYVDLLERAKSLLSHAMPSRSLEEIHLRAMRGLVAELEKQRFDIGRNRVRPGALEKQRAERPRFEARPLERPPANSTPSNSTPANKTAPSRGRGEG